MYGIHPTEKQKNGLELELCLWAMMKHFEINDFWLFPISLQQQHRMKRKGTEACVSRSITSAAAQDELVTFYFPWGYM